MEKLVDRKITNDEAEVLRQIYLLEGISFQEELLQDIRLSDFCDIIGIDIPSNEE